MTNRQLVCVTLTDTSVEVVAPPGIEVIVKDYAIDPSEDGEDIYEDTTGKYQEFIWPTANGLAPRAEGSPTGGETREISSDAPSGL